MKNKQYKLLLFFGLLVMYYIFALNNITIPCLFNKITNLYCPGCGVTRMLLSISKLNFYQAFRYNQLVFIFLPFILLLLIDFLLKWLKNQNNYIYLRINNKVWVVLLIIVLVFGILRNIPLFDYLKPIII